MSAADHFHGLERSHGVAECVEFTRQAFGRLDVNKARRINGDAIEGHDALDVAAKGLHALDAAIRMIAIHDADQRGRRFCGVHLSRDHNGGCKVGVCNELKRPAQPPTAIFVACNKTRRDVRGVRRVGQGHAADHRAGRYAGQPLLLLRGRTEPVQRLTERHGAVDRRRAQDPPRLHEGQSQIEETSVAAKVFRQGETEQPYLGKAAPQRRNVVAVRIGLQVPHKACGTFLGEEAAEGLLKGFLFGVQGQVHLRPPA